MGEKVHFSIDHIDPLGQGVHKDGDKICFIPKTLPGEIGKAEIIKRSKGVSFGRLIHIEQASPIRIKPECAHFDQCPGCQFLHAPYEFEIECKQNALLRMLKSLNISKVESHSAPTRWSYRNRMQLHYDKKSGELGMRTPEGILKIDQCLMPNAELKQAYIDLYKNWRELVKNEPNQGHIEIYARDHGVQISINKAYADGGFTQIYADMNAHALNLVKNFTDHLKIRHAIDLFGGAGNLSAHLTHTHVNVIDGVTPKSEFPEHQQFSQLDLYGHSAMYELKKSLPPKTDLLIVDPPRSGFAQLKECVDHFKPQHLVYMSCFSPTMVRDLKEITFTEAKFHMLDFFPSTHHYETLAFIKLK